MAWISRSTILKQALCTCLKNHGVATIMAVMLILISPKSILWYLLYVGAIIFLTGLIAPFVNDWRTNPRVSTQGKAVFITGCDSGFGHFLAQRLDDLGLVVFAGCLLPDEDGAKLLKKSCSSKMHIIPLDVTLDESVETAAQYVMDNIGDNKLWCVVNNAGINSCGDIAWNNMDKIQYVMNVNTLGVVRTTKAFLPMLCKGKGRVVTVASAAGRGVLPGIVPYCMSKNATVILCEGFRVEMLQFGVKFVTIEPWFYKTPLTNEDNIASKLLNTWNDSPDTIRELYPKNYIKYYMESVKRILMRCNQRNPQEVIDCLEEAVLAVDPKYVYNPGWFVLKLLTWIRYMLPKEIEDAVVYLYYSMHFDYTE